MSAIYDNQSGNLDAYIKGFTIMDWQTGFEALNKPETFRHAWSKLIKSYALDAINMRMSKEPPPFSLDSITA